MSARRDPGSAPGAGGAWRSQLGPLAAIAAGAWLRFQGLGTRPMWTDEGCTWTSSTLPVTDLLHRCVTRDASPPLFYLVTSMVLRVRDDEWHLRLVPALASVVLVWLTYRLARLGLGRGAATFAAFLTALSPFQVMYGQEARTYTPVAALMLGAMLVYARLQQKPGPQRWLPLVLLTAAGLWTQAIAALGAASQGVIAVVTPAGRSRFRPWAGAMAVAAVLYLPWLLYSRKMGEKLGDSHWYIPEASPHGVFNVLRAAAVSPLPLVTAPPGSAHPGLGAYLPQVVAFALVGLPALAGLVLSLRHLATRGPRGFLSRLCWLAWLVPVVMVIIVSLKQSLLLPRYFVFLGPYVAVLIAMGVASVRPAPVRAALGAWLFAISLLGLFRYEQDFTKESWRDLVAHIRAASPGGGAVLVPFDADPVAYYLRDGRSGLRPVEVRHPDSPYSATFTRGQLDEAEEATRLEIRNDGDVWVIVRSAHTPGRRELAERTLAAAAEGRVLAESTTWRSYNAPLHATRFVRPDSSAAAPAR